MNVNSSAADAYLRLSCVFRGVDAVMQAPSGVRFPLYSSESSGSSSSSDSGDSSISSVTMDDAYSLPSMQQGDDDSSISSVETDSSEDTMDRFMSDFTTTQAQMANHHNAGAFDGSDASFYDKYNFCKRPTDNRPKSLLKLKVPTHKLCMITSTYLDQEPFGAALTAPPPP
jgi:hypothetical protein